MPKKQTYCSMDSELEGLIKNFKGDVRTASKAVEYEDEMSEMKSALKDLVYNAESFISDLEFLSGKMKDAATSMENRLSKYRSAIEDLGFHRMS